MHLFYKVVFICNSRWLLSDYPEVMHSCNGKVVIFNKNQVKTFSSFLGQCLFSAEDEVVTEEKRESLSFEISKNGLTCEVKENLVLGRGWEESVIQVPLWLVVTDLSQCSFRKGPEFLLLQCITCPLKDLQSSNHKKEEKILETAHANIAMLTKSNTCCGRLVQHKNNQQHHLTVIVALFAHIILSPPFSSQSGSVHSKTHTNFHCVLNHWSAK